MGGKFVTGAGVRDPPGAAPGRPAEAAREQPGSQLGGTVCISEKLVMDFNRLLLFYFKQVVEFWKVNHCKVQFYINVLRFRAL